MTFYRFSLSFRGHSSLNAALHSCVEVKRHEDYRSWELVKSEDGVQGALLLEPVEVRIDNKGRPVNSIVVVPTDLPEDPEAAPTQFIGRRVSRSNDEPTTFHVLSSGGKTAWTTEARSIAAEVLAPTTRFTLYFDKAPMSCRVVSSSTPPGRPAPRGAWARLWPGLSSPFCEKTRRCLRTSLSLPPA